jgi:hypothetical protein
MKRTIATFSCIILSICSALGVSDDFNDGVIDGNLWSFWNIPDPAKNQILEESGKINFVFTNLGSFEEGFAGLRYQGTLNNESDFNLSIQIDHNISEIQQPNLGIALEPVAGGGLLFFDLFADGNFRIYLDDRNIVSLVESPGVSGGFISTLNLFYDSDQEIIYYSADEDGIEIFTGSVGIGSISGNLGVVDWSMAPSDSFYVTLFASTFGDNSVSGDLTMDNFSLVVVPEPKHSIIFVGMGAMSFIYFRRRARTSRWW